MRVWLSLILLSVAAPAFAQQTDRIPPFVIDARGAYVRLTEDATTAKALGVTVEDLATRGLGLVGGVHLYPFRRGVFALGMGGELLLARAKRQNFDEATGDPLGPEVRRQFQSLSFQLSFNFGHRQGWSYLTAGVGPLGFDTYLADTLPDGARPMTTNFGFGARWFNTDHVAFSLDLRFYSTQPADATLVVGARERSNVMVFSAGISLK